ncbi:hypothetical protein Ocin01_04803 [Orchesella cincta]|uniref:Uncharacterized protein n=1 Tax=Orchesella cincta TaxID=48709 RepID=A0A1D2N9F7_ORCCI|nr:hypothetical protein Ocin01_04803 [Orchesella cincta]
MGKFRYILLASVLLAVAFAAPKEESESTEVEAKAEKKSTPAERQVDVVNEDWGTWLASNYGGVAVTGVALILILAGVGYGVYHFYYVQYGLGATGYAADNQYGQPHTFNQYPGQYPGGQYGAYTGRALDLGSQWNFTKVLEYIEIAQKTYEGFDWQDLNCQKRTLCELVQKQNEPWGETGRKLANSYVYRVMDALDGVPIPRVIQTYLKEYKEAISQGKNSSKDCGQVYANCKFSIKDVLAKSAAKKKA